MGSSTQPDPTPTPDETANTQLLEAQQAKKRSKVWFILAIVFLVGALGIFAEPGGGIISLILGLLFWWRHLVNRDQYISQSTKYIPETHHPYPLKDPAMPPEQDQYGRPAFTPDAPPTAEQVKASFPGIFKAQRMAEEIARLTHALHVAEGNREQLQRFIDANGGQEVWEQGKALHQIQEQIKAGQGEASQLGKKTEVLRREIPQLREEIRFSQSALEDFAHPAESYVDLQNDLRELRAEIKESISAKTAVDAPEDQTLPTAAGKKKQLVRNVGRIALRAYNLEAENIIRSANKIEVQH